jgi:AraC family transcriptional regulator
MHQDVVLSILPSTPKRLNAVHKPHPAGTRPGLEHPGLTDLISASRASTKGEFVFDEQLRIVLADLVDAVRSLLQNEHESAAVYLRRASEILELDRDGPSSKIEHQSPECAEFVRGGLAPWQIRRVSTYIEEHLVETIRNRELATLVRLSSFHFCRAFRQSFGDSPHRYIVRRRVERAQGLMLTTTVSLAHIAVSCGIADQAYLNKLFRRLVGETPGSWRRARMVESGSSGRATSEN